MDNSMEIQDIRTRLEQFQANKDPRLKNTMSVPEMRRLLGLKKTESYWLVHRNFFETKIIDGKMRVDIESFEKWYANQVKHKKVNGEEPGAELMKTSYSFKDAANLLGINSSNRGHPLPLGQGVDHLCVPPGVGNVEGDGPLHAVEIVVQAGGRLDEKRRGHAAQIQFAGERILKRALNQADGALRFIQRKVRRIARGNKRLTHRKSPF